MNFLKKKIKNVVHGKRNKDDDDDFDNYVPEVPPHPSTLAENGVPSHAIENFVSFQSNQNSTSSAFDPTANLTAGLDSQDNQEQDDLKETLSLEELKAREEDHKRVEKEK